MDILIPLLVFASIGLILGFLLSIASIFFKVKVDPTVEALIEIMPGANCGGCGYAGCSGLAVAISKGEAPTNACTAGGKETALKAAEIMGVSFGGFEEKKAFVKCGGCDEFAIKKYTYIGADDCISASKLSGGDKACLYGCLGLGSCVRECQFDAIKVINGIAKVDYNKCTGCGRCAIICPKNVIDMLPAGSQYAVACSSIEKPALVRSVCSTGCFSCRLCVRACKYNAISVNNNLAYIDQSKCTSCGDCAEVCPKDIIYFESNRITLERKTS